MKPDDRIDDHELRALLRRADFEKLTWGQVAAAAVQCPTCYQMPGRPCVKVNGLIRGLVAHGRRSHATRTDALNRCAISLSILEKP